MSELQIYCTLMFFAGAAFTKALFYFEHKKSKNLFHTYVSATILQILDCVHSVHESAIKFTEQQTKNIEEDKRQEYLEKENAKVSVFMELYLLVFLKAVPKEGRKFVNYKSWPEAKATIEKLRGIMKSEQSKG